MFFLDVVHTLESGRQLSPLMVLRAVREAIFAVSMCLLGPHRGRYTFGPKSSSKMFAGLEKTVAIGSTLSPVI